MHRACYLLVFGIQIVFLSAHASADEKRPNVLMIAIDDLNDWVGFLGGHPQTKTPNLDRLAAQSMVFENAQCPGVACNPSRSALLSGIAPYRSKMYRNQDAMRSSPVLRDAVMLPRYFSDHGYTSLGRGKIFHHATGPGADPQSWDILSDQQKDSIPVPPERLTNMNPFENIRVDNQLLFVQKPRIAWKATQQPKELTTDYQNALWAAQWLTDSAEQKTPVPFFLACGIFRPHLPWTVPAEFYARFDLRQTRLPPIKDDDLADIRGAGPSKEYLYAKAHHLREEVVWAYLANIAYADDCVGVILDALEKSPYAENTIVVLWSDHGWHVGEKLRYKKSTLWEETARTVLLIKAPGLQPGRTKRPVSLVDLYPTLIELAGLPDKTGLSGRSIAPLLKDPEIQWNYPAITSSPAGHSFRTERWRYIARTNGAEELYDHDNDPHEWSNLADDPQYNAVKDKLRKFLPAD